MRDYKRLLDNNYFYRDNCLQLVRDFAKKEKIQEEFLFTVLLTNHKKDIKDIYQRTREFVPKYEIKQAKYNPQVYKEVCRVGKMFTDTSTSLFCEKSDATANIGELPFDQMLKRVAAL